MVMEEEVKGLLKDIKRLEDKREAALYNKDTARNESLAVLYQKEADELLETIQRKTEILRIISKD